LTQEEDTEREKEAEEIIRRLKGPPKIVIDAVYVYAPYIPIFLTKEDIQKMQKLKSIDVFKNDKENKKIDGNLDV
jgi:stage III sporulation protein SpoIIIAA